MEKSNKEYFLRKPASLEKATPKLKRKNGIIAQRSKGSGVFSRTPNTKLPAKTYS